MRSPATVNVSSALALAHHLLSRDHADAPLIETTLGMTLGELEDPDARIPVQDYIALWRLALELTGDPALGLRLGEIVDPDRMGLLSHIVFNSDTVEHSLDEYLRLHRLVNESIHLYRIRRDDTVRVVWHVPDESLYCIPDMDRTLSAAITRARHFIHPRLALTELTLRHEDPGYRAQYERIFQCPVHFACADTSLSFPVEHLKAPLPHRNPFVYSALMGHVNRLLKTLRPRRTFADQVTRIIRDQLPQAPDVDRVAAALNMSRQTLYRKLKKDGDSFQHLADSVRCQQAEAYVGSEDYALSEVAFLLGFSELSAFSRAFKRWKGESPGEFRARHR